jgi:hypothetical protein
VSATALFVFVFLGFAVPLPFFIWFDKPNRKKS